MESSLVHFQEFLHRRRAAAQAYVEGDAAPVAHLSTTHSPASFFGPQGGTLTGAKEVGDTYQADATSFQPGGESELEFLHVEAGEDFGFWTGLQHARVRFRGKDQPVAMTLRITEIFRREDGEWKLVHRHADALAENPKVEG